MGLVRGQGGAQGGWLTGSGWRGVRYVLFGLNLATACRYMKSAHKSGQNDIRTFPQISREWTATGS